MILVGHKLQLSDKLLPPPTHTHIYIYIQENTTLRQGKCGISSWQWGKLIKDHERLSWLATNFNWVTNYSPTHIYLYIYMLWSYYLVRARYNLQVRLYKTMSGLKCCSYLPLLGSLSLSSAHRIDAEEHSKEEGLKAIALSLRAHLQLHNPSPEIEPHNQKCCQKHLVLSPQKSTHWRSNCDRWGHQQCPWPAEVRGTWRATCWTKHAKRTSANQHAHAGHSWCKCHCERSMPDQACRVKSNSNGELACKCYPGSAWERAWQLDWQQCL